MDLVEEFVTIESLKEEISALRKERDALSESVQAQHAEIIEYAAHVNSLNTQLAMVAIEKARVHSELNKFKNTFEGQINFHAQSLEQNSAHELAIATSHEKISEYRAVLVQLQQRCVAQDEEITTLHATIEAKDQEIQSLDNVCQEALASMESECSAFQSHVTFLESDRENLKHELDNLKIANALQAEMFARQIKAANRDIGDLQMVLTDIGNKKCSQESVTSQDEPTANRPHVENESSDTSVSFSLCNSGSKTVRSVVNDDFKQGKEDIRAGLREMDTSQPFSENPSLTESVNQLQYENTALKGLILSLRAELIVVSHALLNSE